METEGNNKITFAAIVACIAMIVLIGVYFAGYNAGRKQAQVPSGTSAIDIELVDSLRRISDSLYRLAMTDTIYLTETRYHTRYIHDKERFKNETYLNLPTVVRADHFRWLRDSTDRFDSIRSSSSHKWFICGNFGAADGLYYHHAQPLWFGSW